MQTQTYGTKHCTHALSTFSQREALTEHVDSEDMLNECGGTRVSGTRVELWFDPSQWLGYEWASEDNPYSDDACAPAKPCSLHSPGPRHKCQGDSSAKRHRRTNENYAKPLTPAGVRGPSFRAREFSPRKPSHRKGRRDDPMRSETRPPACLYQSSGVSARPQRDRRKRPGARRHTRSGVCEALSLPPAAPWINKETSSATDAAGSDVPGLPKRSLAHLVIMR